jgi:hypothetical protein
VIRLNWRAGLKTLIQWLERNGEDPAAASLREGLEETLTVLRFDLPACSPAPCAAILAGLIKPRRPRSDHQPPQPLSISSADTAKIPRLAQRRSR